MRLDTRSGFSDFWSAMTTRFLALAILLPSLLPAAPEPGFTSLFDGKTLNGWKLVGKTGQGYGVEEGRIFCAKASGGRLFTEKEYADFIFRFEFKLDEGSNNGLAIRSPLEGDPAYVAMELQILDDNAVKRYGKLRPEQYHGSIYDVVA